MKKRMIITLITGAILGVFCIVGAQARTTETLETTYLFSFWFNRLLMGFVIGLFISSNSIKVLLIRGLLIGIFVSFAFYSATNFKDLTGFLVGGVYGIIIEFVAFKLDKK